MNTELLEVQDNLRTTVSDEVSLLDQNIDRFRVFTPFKFEDGELLLKVNDNNFGASFYDFVQVLVKITNLSFLKPAVQSQCHKSHCPDF